MTNYTDVQWIHLLKERDPQALDALWELLYRASQFKKYQDDGDAQQCAASAAEQAYFKILEVGIVQYNFQCPFPGYCMKFFVNKFYDLIKQHNRRHKHLTPINEETEKIKDIEMSIEQQLINQDILTAFKGCLKKLTAPEQKVFVSAGIEENTPQEGADALQISRNYFNVIYFRGRKKLQDCLKSKGFDGAE